MNTVEESRRARLEGKTEQHRELKREAVRLFRRNKEGQVHGDCEAVESHLWLTDYRPANRGIWTLRSSRPPPRCSTVKVADRTKLTGIQRSGPDVLATLRSCIVWTPRP